MMRRVALLVPVMALALAAPSGERVDTDVYAKIRQEGAEHSQVLRTMHFLTDVYGPRLTGSPNLKAAGEWAIRQMKEWGLENGHLEPWDFGHPGWLNERYSGHITAPVKDALVGEVVAWTPGTNGPLTCAAVQIVPPDRPTQEQLTAFFQTEKDKVKGKIVLVGKHTVVQVNLNPLRPRREDEQVRRQYDPVNPQGGQFGRPGGPGGPGGPQQPQPGVLTAQQVALQMDEFLVSNGALMKVTDAGRPHGIIATFNNRTFDLAKAVPSVVLRNEDYGRITRLLADGGAVELEFNIVNRVYPEGRTAYNAVAEIPGTDKKDEVIMLGGHLDSWHSATGATDNADASAALIEAMRILSALGVKPRRTIRMALWGGEEEGLLGSRAYAAQHYAGDANAAAREKLSVYFNSDPGSGPIYGWYLEENAEIKPIFDAWLEPLKALGARRNVMAKIGNTDHLSFTSLGVPAFNSLQDYVDYDTRMHHTNMDFAERVKPDDLKQNAIVLASFAWHAAMRDRRLPRGPRPNP